MEDYGKVMGWVLATFAFLNGLHAFLAFLADRTEANWDNKAAKGLGFILRLGQKVLGSAIAKTEKK